MVGKRNLRRIRRRLYEFRAFVPGLRRRHYLESLVGPLGCWNELQRYQLRVLLDLGLQPNDALLDIGCGPLQGGIAFIRYLAPGLYFGLDSRPEVVNAALSEISRHRLSAKQPTVLLSQSFGEEHLGKAQFDFIWLSQILYELDESLLHRLFAMARIRLRPGGIIAGDILGPDTSAWSNRQYRPFAHTPSSMDRIAAAHGLQTSTIGVLSEYGYPRRMNLSHNLLLKITHR